MHFSSINGDRLHIYCVRKHRLSAIDQQHCIDLFFSLFFASISFLFSRHSWVINLLFRSSEQLNCKISVKMNEIYSQTHSLKATIRNEQRPKTYCETMNRQFAHFMRKYLKKDHVHMRSHWNVESQLWREMIEFNFWICKVKGGRNVKKKNNKNHIINMFAYISPRYITEF